VEICSRSLRATFRQVVGSRATALETLLVLRQVVSKARFSNIDQLVEIIRSVGRRLVDAQPKGLSHFLASMIRDLESHTACDRTLCRKHCTKGVAPHTRRIPYCNRGHSCCIFPQHFFHLKVCHARTTTKTKFRIEVWKQRNFKGKWSKWSRFFCEKP